MSLNHLPITDNRLLITESVRPFRTGSKEEAISMSVKLFFQCALLLKIPYFGLFVIVTLSLFLCTFLAFFGRFHWFLDLFSHFAAQYFVVASICFVAFVLFAIWSRRKGESLRPALLWCGAAFLLIIVNGVFALQVDIPFPSDVATVQRLRLMHINVNSSNTRYDDVARFIKEKDPDILLLEEVTPEWLLRISNATKEYHYQEVCGQDDNFGIALFSKIKPIESRVKFYGRYALPYIRAVFEVEGKRFVFFGVHTIPPIGASGFSERNAMLNDIAEWVSAKGNDLAAIVLGDLNITPYSYFFRKLLSDADLRDSRMGFGIQPTWPSSPCLLMIPLDHCLVSKNIAVRNRFVGTDIGSDHYPIVVDIQLR